MKKIIVNGQRRNKNFLVVIYHSSLVKGAMNAARLCKLQQWCLFGTDSDQNRILEEIPRSGVQIPCLS
jgi:hypothetical protein